MKYLDGLPAKVGFTTQISKELLGDDLGGLTSYLDEIWMDEHQKFVKRGGRYRWGDNSRDNPAYHAEHPDMVLWDKTREETEWWWLGEDDECWC